MNHANFVTQSNFSPAFSQPLVSKKFINKNGVFSSFSRNGVILGKLNCNERKLFGFLRCSLDFCANSLKIHEDSMQIHALNHMINKNPCDFIHGIKS